jgi:hypothetical protein
MDFPPKLRLREELLVCHPEYSEMVNLYEKIDDLVEGGWRIDQKRRKYLPQRPGEDPKIYDTRLKRFTYTNVLGEAINKQIASLATGSIDLDDAEDALWEDFRGATDKLGKRSEMDLLQEIFRLVLKHGGGYLHIEKEQASAEYQNRLQETIAADRTYVCLYSKAEVINWGHDAAGHLEWLKILQLHTQPDPFAKAKTIATWTFITPEQIAKYSAPVRLKDGQIVELDQPEGVSSAKEEFVPLVGLVDHGFGRLPIVHVDAPIDLWTAYATYLTAQQALDLENSRYDVGAMSYIQRTWRPVQRPDADLDETFTDEEAIQSSNAHILKVDTFAFNESGGVTIEKLGDYVAELHDAIRQAYGQFGSSSSKSPEQMSGLSKQMDFAIQKVLLIGYGAFVVNIYQQVLQLVSIALGIAKVPSVSGFDNFEIDSLDDLMLIAESLPKVAKLVPKTALKLFAKQLSGQLVRRVSSRSQAEIDGEIEAMFAGVVDLSEDDRNDDRKPRVGDVSANL